MDILFKDIDELRKHLNFLYASADFDNFVSDLEIATEEVIEIVGEDIYNKALSAYAGEASIPEYKALLPLFQRPISLFAYLSYAENADVSHEDSGRKVKIDKESESIPWEWQIVKDDAALRKKANKAIDRLIAYMDKNIDKLPQWRDSEQRKDINFLFVKNAKEFDEVVPIDSSRTFYLRVLPFVKSEDKRLSTHIGKDRYNLLKKQMNAGDLTEDNKKIVEFCREIIPLRVMEKAIRRFAVQVLPESVVMRFQSERQTLSASNPVTPEMIRMVEAAYKADADLAISALETFIKQINPLPVSSREQSDYSNEKFFTI